MITEKRFATSHHAFWRELLPMGEHYIRAVNVEVSRYCEPLNGPSAPRFHGIVNELAFRLFVKATKENRLIDSLKSNDIAVTVREARRFIESFRQHGRGRVPRLGEAELGESIDLAKRIRLFFHEAANAPLILQPHFLGCGWLSECEGDVLSGNVLYEIKAGERAFRMVDVKQLLVYCALNFSAKSFDIREVCLLNPREGTYFAITLSNVCELIAGTNAVDVLGDIVQYVSEPNDQYGTA